MVAMRLRVRPLALAAMFAASILIPSLQAQPLVDIETVMVGDAGNAADQATGFGTVNRSFRISEHRVTIADYVTFLNAVAKDDPHQLYNPRMATDLMVAGIRREGVPGSYVYSAMEPSGSVQSSAATAGGRPVTYVSWFDAARFANWMSNGQPTGAQTPRTTENGAYDLTRAQARRGIAVRRNAINPNTRREPSYYIPTEDEWYKAAYFNPTLNDGAGGYTLYATASNTAPGNVAGNSANQANYVAGGGLFAMTQQLSLDPNQNYLTDVGALTATPGPYGTYDMNGSMWGLTDMDARPGLVRTIRGGGWTSYYSYLQSDYRLGNATDAASSNVGFRLAASSNHASTIGYALTLIGNPGNRADATGFGAVAKAFWIGTYEITIGQYCVFLNAVAKSDLHGVYDLAMTRVANSAGIERLGSDGSYSYAPLDNAGDSSQRPITYVSWFDAARFANWMANGQPEGAQGPATTEDGAYRLSGATSGAAVARNRVNPNRGGQPTFWLPTENQWYKAAYYSPQRNEGKGGYYRYATASDTAPGNVIGGQPNMANYINDYNLTYFYSVPQARYIDPGQNYLLDVGVYTASPSHYGTFDQSGSVYDWNDLDGRASASRGLRGGFFFAGAASIQSVTFAQVSPLREGADAGFRLASPRAEAPRFLSAFWGLDDGMPQQICPDATACDGMPITFSWLINPASIDPADFNVIRSDGTVTVPAFATLRPANESNETQTILLTGDFGDAESGVRPVQVRLVGQLVGSPPGSKRSGAFSDLVSPPIRRLSAGPSIVDAWRIDPALLTNDANACTVGSAFVRVVWSGGITDFPTGNEVGVAVTRAYRLTYLHQGKTVTVAPLEIGDLNDGDNMHDLSFPAIPAGAKLLTITLPGRHVEDPNGDPNSFQVFRFREPNLYLTGLRPSRR